MSFFSRNLTSVFSKFNDFNLKMFFYYYYYLALIIFRTFVNVVSEKKIKNRQKKIK